MEGSNVQLTILSSLISRDWQFFRFAVLLVFNFFDAPLFKTSDQRITVVLYNISINFLTIEIIRQRDGFIRGEK